MHPGQPVELLVRINEFAAHEAKKHLYKVLILLIKNNVERVPGKAHENCRALSNSIRFCHVSGGCP